MGISLNGMKLILQALGQGAEFNSVLTIGRLGLHLQKHRLQKILMEAGIPDVDNFDVINQLNTEELLSMLGASKVDSVDVSDYQNCSIVHDLNRPLPEVHHRKYDAVIEGGTIEHVFNVPMALQNCMDAVAEGGRLFIMQMGGNNAGHGFYCFSPEFFYRALDKKYGFEIEHVLVYEYINPEAIYSVKDSKDAKGLVNVTTDFGSTILVQAKRIGEGKSLLEDPPQQYFYENKWEAGKESRPAVAKKHSFLHDKAWYSEWQWDRRVKKKAIRSKKSAYFGNPNHFKPFTFDLSKK